MKPTQPTCGQAPSRAVSAIPLSTSGTTWKSYRYIHTLSRVLAAIWPFQPDVKPYPNKGRFLSCSGKKTNSFVSKDWPMSISSHNYKTTIYRHYHAQTTHHTAWTYPLNSTQPSVQSLTSKTLSHSKINSLQSISPTIDKAHTPSSP